MADPVVEVVVCVGIGGGGGVLPSRGTGMEGMPSTEVILELDRTIGGHFDL